MGGPDTPVKGRVADMWRVGIDSGGTFTDVCLVDAATGDVRVWKVPSTPDDPSRAIAHGVVGPAAGVVGGLEVGRAVGLRHLITFDMGGTSTDVSLIADGRPKLAGEMEVHGYPLRPRPWTSTPSGRVMAPSPSSTAALFPISTDVAS